jgi:hypothetical protein
MKKHSALTALAALLFAASFPGGCGTVVDSMAPVTGISAGDISLSVENYTPRTAQALLPYKNKAVMLREFINRAENTRKNSYPSQDTTLWYRTGKGPVGKFFRASFEKALTSAGMVVYESTGLAATPKLELKILHITDRSFRGEATLYTLDGPTTKMLDIVWPPAKNENPETLEQNAYAHMDAIVTTLFTDPRFTRAFFKK